MGLNDKLQQLKQNIQTAKQGIVDALNEKGVVVDENSNLSDMVMQINNVSVVDKPELGETLNTYFNDLINNGISEHIRINELIPSGVTHNPNFSNFPTYEYLIDGFMRCQVPVTYNNLDLLFIKDFDFSNVYSIYFNGNRCNLFANSDNVILIQNIICNQGYIPDDYEAETSQYILCQNSQNLELPFKSLKFIKNITYPYVTGFTINGDSLLEIDGIDMPSLANFNINTVHKYLKRIANLNMPSLSSFSNSFSSYSNLETIENINWSGITSISYAPFGSSSIKTFRNVRLDSLESINGLFSNMKGCETFENVSFPMLENAENLFNCFNIVPDLSFIDTSIVKNATAMFHNINNKFITGVSFSNGNLGLVDNMFAYSRKLMKIDSDINITNAYKEYSWDLNNNMFDYCENLREIRLIGLGSVTTTITDENGDEKTVYPFTSISLQTTMIGIDDEENGITGCKDSLIYSFITKSYDRAANGIEDVFTIKINSTTSELFTEDEIAAITSKGYTISVE